MKVGACAACASVLPFGELVSVTFLAGVAAHRTRRPLQSGITCNSGLVSPIPAFGIEDFLIPGSRREWNPKSHAVRAND